MLPQTLTSYTPRKLVTRRLVTVQIDALREHALTDMAIIVPFLVFLFIPVVVMAVHPGYGAEHFTDQRKIYAPPSLPGRLEDWNRLPWQCEKFFADRICLRNKLIRLQSLVGLRLLGAAPLGTNCLKPRHDGSGTVTGEDDWLFCAGHGSLAGSRGNDPFSAEELEQWRDVHVRRERWLRERGIGYLFVVGPDKHSIYPEFVPPCMKRTGAASRLDQLHQHLRQFAPQVELLDLRPALIQAKSLYPCYHRTDTHWNRFGAFVAVSSILKRVGEKYPQKGVLPTLANHDVHPVDSISGDLARALKVARYYPDFDFNVTPKSPPSWTQLPAAQQQKGCWTTEHTDTSKPRILLISDSFGWNMAKYFPDSCSRFTWYMQIHKDEFPTELVEHESPDLVIFEHVERKLNYVDPLAVTSASIPDHPADPSPPCRSWTCR